VADEDQELEANEAEADEELDGEQVEGEDGEVSVKKKSDGQKSDGSAGGPSQKMVVMVLALNIIVLGAIAALVWMNLSKHKSEVTLNDVKQATDA